MPDSFEVGVVIPVYNGEKYIADAVRSALRQTVPPKEVIVVDDGSTDSTREVLSTFGQQIAVIRQRNKGCAAARNAGIGKTRTEWIGFLDADDMWKPNKLERMSQAIPGQHEVGLLFSAVEHWWEHARRRQIRRRDRDSQCRRLYQELAGTNAVLGGGSGAVVRRSCLLDAGLFDETLRSAEDWDMWIRIARSWRAIYVDDVLTTYREHASGLSKNAGRMLKANLRVFAKHEPQFVADGFSGRSLCVAASKVYTRSAVAYLSSGEVTKARALFWKAVHLDPLNTKASVPLLKMILGMKRELKITQRLGEFKRALRFSAHGSSKEWR